MQPGIELKNILFPTDFSKSSEAVALHVGGLAKATGARVTALNIVPWLSAWHGASEPYFEIGDDVLRKLALNQSEIETINLEMLEKLKRQYFSGLHCETRVRTGGVAESIVECSEELGADLIMMATRGIGSPRPFLIGSVTAKVLHDARCAVWTSPHPRELDDFRHYRQIICAIDYRLLSSNLLQRASQLAQLFASRLSIVSAIPHVGAASNRSSEGVSTHSLKAETAGALQNLLRELSIDAKLHILEGTVGEAIRQAVVMDDGDLVVIGRGRLDQSSGHLRTHAYEIIWNSPCPVLSI